MAHRATDPFASYNFLVESAGLIQAGFSECTGLNSETNIVEYREGADDSTVRKLTGLAKFGNVTLKRGVAVGTQMFEWRRMVTEPSDDAPREPRRNISILLLDEKRAEQVRYNLKNAWPSKWTGPDFKAAANEIAIEQLEICHEGVTIG
ncbi:MAG TPA: phage tail protein [Vicinamibacterales bacterium]|jgi:phage tail-like protein|nr:phage tail protein [Vicinamibacterales bacterium]